MSKKINNEVLGKYSIIRTYSAGVWYGKVAIKDKNEVILNNARRLYYWKTNGGISLSEVALTGLNDDSKVTSKVNKVWLEAIEIIPCTSTAITSIDAKKDYVN